MNKGIAAIVAIALVAGVSTGCGSEPDCVEIPVDVKRSITTGITEPGVSIAYADGVKGSIGSADSGTDAYVVAARMKGGWIDGDTAVWRVGASGSPVLSADAFADRVSDWPLVRNDSDLVADARKCLT